MEIAEELAKKQRAISVAEFFEKNRQILGFDSAPRALITCVKEAVDNALDACEDAGILPDIFVQISRQGEFYRIVVEDNGPGIVGGEIPKVFAKLLYGSRFHALKQSRGQQGIGISAAVLYSQLTSGKPTVVTSKIGPGHPALRVELLINTSQNEPEILSSGEVEWERPRGTSVMMEIEGSYVRGRRQSVSSYLKNVAIVNPHARITLVEPEGNIETFERATENLPKPAYEIQPHPEGIELGGLIKMLRYTERKKLLSFLRESFSRIGYITAEEICKLSDLDTEREPADLSHEEARRLLAALKQVKVKSPPTDCLSPIGEDLIRAGLSKEYRVDFIATSARPVAVYAGNPFVVEVGLAYGGDLQKEGRVEILRFANRVPLLYQQGACAITHAIENMPWRNYSLGQPGGGVPVGPGVIMVHVASTNIPFTSESKDSIADLPVIIGEIDLGLKDVARKLRRHLTRQSILSERREKEEIIKKILPRIALKLSQILEREEPDIGPVVAKIMGNLSVRRTVSSQNGRAQVRVEIANHSDVSRSFMLHELLSDEAESLSPNALVTPFGSGYDYRWKLSLKPGERADLCYTAGGRDVFLSEPVIDGLPEEIVTGARVVKL